MIAEKLSEAVGSLRTILPLLGHRSLKTTTIYLPVSQAQLQDADSRWNFSLRWKSPPI